MGRIIDMKEAQEKIRGTFTPEYMQKNFTVNEEQAKETIRDPDKVEKMLLDLEKKLASFPKLGGTLAYVPTMISLVRSYLRREYTQVSVVSIGVTVLALAYVLAPIDLIPDAIPLVGMLDDAAVVGFCLNTVKGELDQYRAWRGMPAAEPQGAAEDRPEGSQE